MRGSTCIMNEDECNDETINKFTDDNVETDEVLSHQLQGDNSGSDFVSLSASILWEDLPTGNSLKQQASAQSWDNVRNKLLNAVVENNAMPHNQVCTLCSIEKATSRCTRCGPCVYYCERCLNSFHNVNFVFHMPEEWKVI